MIKPPVTHLSKAGRGIEPVCLKCCNTSRNSISFSQVTHIVFCCWYCEVETREGQSGPSLPALWPWVPDRYKGVRAGQHSSEQVNRASSNPSRGPQSAGAQQRLLQMLTFANTNSLAFWKTKLCFYASSTNGSARAFLVCSSTRALEAASG